VFTNIGIFSVLSTNNVKIILLRICDWGKSARQRAQGAERREKGKGLRVTWTDAVEVEEKWERVVFHLFS
jgi:hypothetical protein